MHLSSIVYVHVQETIAAGPYGIVSENTGTHHVSIDAFILSPEGNENGLPFTFMSVSVLEMVYYHKLLHIV